MIKLLISTLVMAMLAGCVSPNYYPVTHSVYGPAEVSQGYSDDGYYEDSYAGSYSGVQSAAYYPWWSVDYFYLGNYYRPAYGSAFSFGMSSGYPYYGSSFSIGWSSFYPYYGPYYYPRHYAGWYAPYYYYNPWYPPYYGWSGYGRYDPYWRYGYYRHGYRPSYGGHDRGHDGGYGHDRGHDGGYGHDNGSYGYDGRSGHRGGTGTGGVYQQGGEQRFRDREAPPRDRSGRGGTEPVSNYRNVSAPTPSRQRTDGNMVVVNRGDSKPQPNRAAPVVRQENSYRVAPSPSANSRPVTSYSSGQPRVVAPLDNKVRRSYTGVPGYNRGPSPVVQIDPGRAAVQSKPASPRVAPAPRTYRESSSRYNRDYSTDDRQAPRDYGNDDGGRSQRDSGGRDSGRGSDNRSRRNH